MSLSWGPAVSITSPSILSVRRERIASTPLTRSNRTSRGITRSSSQTEKSTPFRRSNPAWGILRVTKTFAIKSRISDTGYSRQGGSIPSYLLTKTHRTKALVIVQVVEILGTLNRYLPLTKFNPRKRRRGAIASDLRRAVLEPVEPPRKNE